VTTTFNGVAPPAERQPKGIHREYQMFDLYILQNWLVAEVARILRVSAAQVYLAKHRISRLLKKEVAKLERGQESGIRV